MCIQVFSSSSALLLKTCEMFIVCIVRNTMYCPFVYSNVLHIYNTGEATQCVIMCVGLYEQTVGRLSVSHRWFRSTPSLKTDKISQQCLKISDHCATAKFQNGIPAVFGWSVYETSKTILLLLLLLVTSGVTKSYIFLVLYAIIAIYNCPL